MTTLTPAHRLAPPLAHPARGPATGRPPLTASARRVTILVAAMFLMGLLDLLFTLTYMSSIGMYELNPIARYIVRNGSIGHLIAFKLLTMGISCGAILAARRFRRTEPAAWLCAIVLAFLMLHWINYADRVQHLSHEFVMLMQNEELAGPAWVRSSD